MSIGDLIKKYRKERGMTQKELSAKCGISINSLSRYETNERQPNIEILNKIADALYINITSFLAFNYEDKEHIELQQELMNIVIGDTKIIMIIELCDDLNDNGKDELITFLHYLLQKEEYTKPEEPEE